jgi:methionyl aminopeptidase
MINLKSDREIDHMRRACGIVARILEDMAQMMKPGISTAEIDHFAESRTKELNAIPAFKGYHGFPASVCISINEEVVHGIPSKKRVLKDGDIVGLDFGVLYEGWYGDAARTIAIGDISSEAQKLLDVTRESLSRGIGQCREGNRVFDIGHAIQNYVEGFGYSVVREFVGHGIGRALHEEPQVPNYGSKGKGLQLKVGMVLMLAATRCEYLEMAGRRSLLIDLFQLISSIRWRSLLEALKY